MGDKETAIETKSTDRKKGKRNLKRIEVKGDPYAIIKASGIQNRLHWGPLIELAYDIKVFTRRQAQDYLGLGPDRTAKILSELYRNRFLDRVFPRVNKGSSEGYYYLDTLGAFYLSAFYEVAKKEISWSARDNLIGAEKRIHTLGVTGIRIALEKHLKLIDRIALVQFYGERRTGRRQFFSDGEEYGLNPDAEAIIKFQESDAQYKRRIDKLKNDSEYTITKVDERKKVYQKRFFFEYDRGTEDLNKLTDKFRKYAKYYASDEFKNRYVKMPALVVLCEGMASRERVEKAISKVINDVEFRLLISDYEVFLEDPMSKILLDMTSNDDMKMASLI